MGSLLFLAVLAFCLFLLFRGLFLVAFRANRRRTGTMIAAAGIVGFFAYMTLDMQMRATRAGWPSYSEMSSAAKEGITDPKLWATLQAEKAAVAAEKEAAANAAAAEKLRAEAEAEAKAKEAEAAAAALDEADRKRKGFHCLSPWDGSSDDLVRQVVRLLRDPDSFEHIETRIGPVKDGRHAVMMEYRARNGFGGYNVEIAAGYIDTETCAATLTETQ